MRATPIAPECFERLCVGENSYDNGNENRGEQRLSKVKKIVWRAIDSELTPNQRELLTEHYFNNKTMTEIARERGINKSTVSRSIKASREKIGFAIKNYSLRLFAEED